MSEQIKITIVTGDEKQNRESGRHDEIKAVVTHDLSATVMSTLLKNGFISGSFCGGRGDCGRCKIQFMKGMTIPTPLERSVMEPDELRQGYRLACLAKPKDDCVIKLALTDTPKIAIISDMIAVTENNDCSSQQNEQTGNRESDVMEQFLIAVDLGTTTVAMQLVEMESGRVFDTYCELNPQRCYGADVLSRIKASCEGNREALQHMIVQVLERGVAQFEKCLSKIEAGGGSEKHPGETSCICAMCIAGNTTMLHLLMGYDVSSLGRSPFVPVENGLQEWKHNAFSFPVWLVPGISAFVGGDIVAGLYALGMLLEVKDDGEQEPDESGRMSGERKTDGNSRLSRQEQQDENSQVSRQENEKQALLLIDLGTNGEMAMTDGEHMIVTATAAGPAFEGGAGAGVVGSDMIACTASLLRQGIADETGLLAEPYFTEGVSVGEPAVRLCNRDIRDLQMAKAAVRAGVEILWQKMGKPEIKHVYLAGGFGYYLDVEAAFSIGLLPVSMRGRVEAAGNTSLAGAFLMGRDLWRRKTDKKQLESSLSSIIKINLAEQEAFEELYLRYLNLCED